jgi:hypothetical protein
MKHAKSLQDKDGQAGTADGQGSRSQSHPAPLGAEGGTARDNRYDLTPDELLEVCGPAWSDVG